MKKDEISCDKPDIKSYNEFNNEYNNNNINHNNDYNSIKLSLSEVLNPLSLRLKNIRIEYFDLGDYSSSIDKYIIFIKDLELIINNNTTQYKDFICHILYKSYGNLSLSYMKIGDYKNSIK